MEKILTKISFFLILICGTTSLITTFTSKSIQDDEINFMVNDENDSILKFKYVLIAFDRIASSMSTWQERKLVLNIPSEEKIIKTDNFTTLQDTAMKLLRKYEIVLLKKTNYNEKAHNYRLLQWFKFSMRRDNVLNTTLEEKIDQLLQDNNNNPFDPLHPLELHKSSYSQNFNSFASVVSYEFDIENKCSKIKTISELREFGVLQDKIVGFCISLGREKSKLAEDITIVMPFYKQIDDYEKLLHDANQYAGDFEILFGNGFIEMLEYLYYALRERLLLPYQHFQIENINLEESKTDKIEYFSDLAKLYFRALKHLLNVKLNFDAGWQLGNKLNRIENFVLDMKRIDKLRTSTSEEHVTTTDKLHVLENMIVEGISAYDKAISNFVERMDVSSSKELSDEFKINYSQLLKWMTAHTKQIIGENGSLYSKLMTNLSSNMAAGGLKNSVASDESSDKVYLAITTYKDLENL